VYGTLMTGRSQAGMLAGLPRVDAQTSGALFHLPAGYPALQAPGSDVVHGELVSPPAEALLRMLDLYEGVDDGLFSRVRLEVRTRGQTLQAWAYVMAHPERHGGRRIRSGRWRLRGRR